MSDTIKLIECPRDAWQGMQGQIPTALKVEYLHALINAGFKHIDAASFVSAKAVPQMADSESVLKELDPPDDVEIIGIVVNEKGAERAIATEAVRTLGFPYSISETFLRRNQHQTAEENFEMAEAIKKLADEAGLDMVVYISMAFGNPYGDPWSLDEVLLAIENISDLEVKSISLADTVGYAYTSADHRTCCACRGAVPRIRPRRAPALDSRGRRCKSHGRLRRRCEAF